MPDQGEPAHEDDRRDRDDAQGRSPTPPDQGHQPGHRDQWDAHARAHQGEHRQRPIGQVAPDPHLIAIDDEEARDSQSQAQDPGHLERPGQVLRARPQEEEYGGQRGGDPGVDMGPDHDPEEQVGKDHVGEQHHDQIRDIGVDTDRSVEASVDQDRDRGPVLVMGDEEVERPAARALAGQEVPFVVEEPEPAVDVEQDCKRDGEGEEVRGQGRVP